MKCSEVLCKNFRQLLWYWREYYLRRGRDRLSIEFCYHIPFSYWNDLVDLLCADDGSETALLSEPISLPLSPYQRPYIGLQPICRFCDKNSIINM